MDKGKEDYLYAIYSIQYKYNRTSSVSDIASKLKVSKPSVSEMIRKLSKDNLVEFEPYKGISLTKQGVIEARKVTRKHQILEVFFSKMLNLKNSYHSQAHKIEHEISDEATENMNALLNNPEKCPDGNPIPSISSKVIELSKLSSGNIAKIVFSKISDNSSISRLNALGIVPSAEIKVTRKIPKGPIMVLIKGSEVAIGNEFGNNIFVEVLK